VSGGSTLLADEGLGENQVSSARQARKP